MEINPSVTGRLLQALNDLENVQAHYQDLKHDHDYVNHRFCLSPQGMVRPCLDQGQGLAYRPARLTIQANRYRGRAWPLLWESPKAADHARLHDCNPTNRYVIIVLALWDVNALV